MLLTNVSSHQKENVIIVVKPKIQDVPGHEKEEKDVEEEEEEEEEDSYDDENDEEEEEEEEDDEGECEGEAAGHNYVKEYAPQMYAPPTHLLSQTASLKTYMQGPTEKIPEAQGVQSDDQQQITHQEAKLEAAMHECGSAQVAEDAAEISGAAEASASPENSSMEVLHITPEVAVSTTAADADGDTTQETLISGLHSAVLEFASNAGGESASSFYPSLTEEPPPGEYPRQPECAEVIPAQAQGESMTQEGALGQQRYTPTVKQVKLGEKGTGIEATAEPSIQVNIEEEDVEEEVEEEVVQGELDMAHEEVAANEEEVVSEQEEIAAKQDSSLTTCSDVNITSETLQASKASVSSMGNSQPSITASAKAQPPHKRFKVEPEPFPAYQPRKAPVFRGAVPCGNLRRPNHLLSLKPCHFP
ncbi:hypothetical protein CEUSTIGMA_g12534.t1 [Chlamydomonas eustigma]|uniref:Uncharacterized protein n=1 Tax=Chlamydomonas eustigma TaxID=1157962 RepID=A0A250XPV2_9CHLO|nr:hypothetical protein CEUSTIGMA_g12534.t1 [Chlamydomonas eustigma]|eukprot:GAX85114.1 hypothetical protein CEUSTIGMA_g12534.t1 [Chlamydomonas eustigma]